MQTFSSSSLDAEKNKLRSKESPKPTTKTTPTSKSTSPPETKTIPVRRLVLKKGELEKSKTDIIVNSVSSNLDLSSGKLSRAILQSAGPEIQKECNNRSEINHFEVVVTEAYNLPCKIVFHICLPPHNSNMNDIIKRYMKKCLQSAEAYSVSSISFPSLGTGQLSYPPVDVAKEMLSVAQQHLSDPSSSLKEVDIIVYPIDDPVLTAFSNEVKNLPKVPNVNVDNQFTDQNLSTVQWLKHSVTAALGSIFKTVIPGATTPSSTQVTSFHAW